MQAGGEREVAEVVGGELQLPALRRAQLSGEAMTPALLTRMCSGPSQRGDERRDGRLVGEVERRDEDLLVAGGRGDVLGGALAGLGVADGEGDLGAGAGQRAGGLDADAGRAAGDDGAAAGQVDAGDDLGGGGVGAERRGDAGAQS